VSDVTADLDRVIETVKDRIAKVPSSYLRMLLIREAEDIGGEIRHLDEFSDDLIDVPVHDMAACAGGYLIFKSKLDACQARVLKLNTVIAQFS
jgi:hypothetical protein